jgi:hypothetical protein
MILNQQATPNKPLMIGANFNAGQLEFGRFEMTRGGVDF